MEWENKREGEGGGREKDSYLMLKYRQTKTNVDCHTYYTNHLLVVHY